MDYFLFFVLSPILLIGLLLLSDFAEDENER